VTNICVRLQLLAGLNKKLELSDGRLPQDLQEGVDPSEWVCVFEQEAVVVIKVYALCSVKLILHI